MKLYYSIVIFYLYILRAVIWNFFKVFMRDTIQQNIKLSGEKKGLETAVLQYCITNALQLKSHMKRVQFLNVCVNLYLNYNILPLTCVFKFWLCIINTGLCLNLIYILSLFLDSPGIFENIDKLKPRIKHVFVKLYDKLLFHSKFSSETFRYIIVNPSC